MKKIFVLIVFTIIFLGLTGCGENKLTKEDMIRQAQYLSVETLKYDLQSNFKNAKDNYSGNIYIIDAGIISIEDDYAKIGLTDVADYNILKVFFNSNELKDLKSYTKVQFVGKINSIDKNDDEIIVTIKNAYYISDYVKIKGDIVCWNYSRHCEIYDGNRNDNHTSYILDMNDISDSIFKTTSLGAKINDVDVSNHDIIELTARLEYNGGFWYIKDIKDIEVKN